MLFIKAETNAATFEKDKLSVGVFPMRDELGKSAAKDVANKIHNLLDEKDEINIIFASAPSQEELIKYLIGDTTIEWNRINAFHMDEYVGLDKDAPQGFGNLL
jgi:glucosamine-6-phosphate deaminase